MTKTSSSKTTRRTTTANTEEVCVRARWASVDCNGAHGNGATFNVTASAKVDGRDFVVYGGNVEMDRENTMRTAFTMIEAVAIMRGLTLAERDRLRALADSVPLFGPSPAELAAAAGGAQAEAVAG